MKHRERWVLHTGLTVAGGLMYVLIELLWRGRSHWSMFLVGGACFQAIGTVGERCRRLPLLVRCGICSAMITVIEGISGCILNIWLKLNVWDYSHMKWNWHGQICAVYSLLWMLLSIVACPVYRGLSRSLTEILHRRAVTR